MSPENCFIVGRIESIRPGQVRIAGRCGDTAVSVGDALTRSAEGINGPAAERFLVERIEAYGHELKTLGSGMVATLDLAGAGGERICESDVFVIESVAPVMPAPISPPSAVDAHHPPMPASGR